MKFVPFIVSIFMLIAGAAADEIKISGPTEGVNFGNSIAVDDTFMIVGAPRDDEQANPDAGAFFIYKKEAGLWQSMGKFMAPDGASDCLLGYSVAISGEYAIAGAPEDDNGDSENFLNSGSMYLYKFEGNQWTFQSKFVAQDKQKLAHYGYKVAMNHNFAFIGAYGQHEADNHSGAVYVYQRSLWGWSFFTKLTESDLGDSDFYGRAIDVDNDILVIGAHQHDPGGGKRTGAVYIYEYDGSSWQFKQKITVDDGKDMDGFGRVVALNGDHLVVGAPFNDDKGDEAGAAYIFKKEAGTWTQMTKLVALNGVAGDRFGWDVAIHDDMVLIGANKKNNPGDMNGSVYTYRLNEGVWRQADIHIPGDETSWSRFGFDIEFTDSAAFISAHPKSALYIYNPFSDLNLARPEVQISDQLINQGEEFAQINLDEFVKDLSDPDADLTWTYSGNTEITISISDRIATITQPDEPWYGSETIRFKAQDPVLLTGWDDVTFTVNAVPQISGLPASVNFPANKADTLNIWDYVEDADNGDAELTYVFTPSTSSLYAAYDNATGELVLTADLTYTGTCSLNIEIKDYNEATSQDILYVTVDPPVGIYDPLSGLPATFALHQNYPNPFNPATIINYELPITNYVELSVYNLIGEKIKTLVRKEQPAGTYKVAFNGANLPSGVYFYKITAGTFTAVRKMILMK